MTLANPAYEFHSTETPLPDIASLKGLKLRSPGDVFAEIIRGVDAIPVEVKTTDQYEALQRGLLDGSIYAFSSWKSFNVNELLLHRSEEHTSELQSLMRISYAVFCLKKKNIKKQ